MYDPADTKPEHRLQHTSKDTYCKYQQWREVNSCQYWKSAEYLHTNIIGNTCAHPGRGCSVYTLQVASLDPVTKNCESWDQLIPDSNRINRVKNNTKRRIHNKNPKHSVLVENHHSVEYSYFSLACTQITKLAQQYLCMYVHVTSSWCPVYFRCSTCTRLSSEIPSKSATVSPSQPNRRLQEPKITKLLHMPRTKGANSFVVPGVCQTCICFPFVTAK